MATPRPGDWYCTACGNLNFASREVCNRCGVPNAAKGAKPNGGKAGATLGGHAVWAPPVKNSQGGGGKGMRDGDWECQSCGNHNFASRVACNRCQAPKPDLMSAMMNMMGGGGYGAMKGGKGGKAAPRFNPYEGAAGMTFPGVREGDWNCAACGNHNFASRAACNKCGAPQASPGKGGKGKRPGDWICSACKNHNFADRVECNKCGLPKEAYISKSGMCEGDWICATCHNHNYADKAICNKCGGPQTNALPYQGPFKDQFKAGDWRCTSCNNHNFADKTVCNRCQAPKPAVTGLAARLVAKGEMWGM